MARYPNPKVNQAKEMFERGIPLVDIAQKIDVPAGTVRRWKSIYKWGKKESERSEKTKKKKANARKDKKKAVAEEVTGVMENAELTDRQQLFCIYYIKSFNATKAYQKAYGCTYETAMQSGSRMLRNVKVRNEIERIKKERFSEEFFSEEDVFRRYMDIAFADINDYVEIKGNQIRFKDSNMVDGSLIKKVTSGKTRSIEMLDQMKALQWLADHMDLATEKQKAEIAVLKAKANEGKDKQEDKLGQLFDMIEGELKDAE